MAHYLELLMSMFTYSAGSLSQNVPFHTATTNCLILHFRLESPAAYFHYFYFSRFLLCLMESVDRVPSLIMGLAFCYMADDFSTLHKAES